MSSSEDFYDPIVAIYDSGVDYLTIEKHRLVSIAKSGWNTLFQLSLNYDDFSENLDIPFTKEDIQLDMEKVSELKCKFIDIKEINSDENWIYEYDYNQGIKELDGVLLKYAEWLDKSVLEIK